MAGVVPTHYQYDTPNDATRIALGRTIGQSGEVADFVERPNFLYASSNLARHLRAVLSPSTRNDINCRNRPTAVLFANEYNER